MGQNNVKTSEKDRLKRLNQLNILEQLNVKTDCELVGMPMACRRSPIEDDTPKYLKFMRYLVIFTSVTKYYKSISVFFQVLLKLFIKYLKDFIYGIGRWR